MRNGWNDRPHTFSKHDRAADWPREPDCCLIEGCTNWLTNAGFIHAVTEREIEEGMMCV